MHERGKLLRKHVQEGLVLTLAPTLPIEAGLKIYPALATGAFAWRGAHLIPAERRHQLGFIAPEDLPALVQKLPPTAVLTGVEDEALEEPLLAYAKSAGFSPVALGKKQQLWVKAKSTTPVPTPSR